MERSRLGGGTDEFRLIRRAGAVVVDAVAVGLAVGLVAVAVSLVVGELTVAGGWGFPVVYLGYYAVLEGVSGRTLGKRAFGLVVVEADGTSCGPRAAAIRTACRVLDGIAFYLVGLVVALVTDGDRRIGDLAAGTRVVYTDE